MRGFLTKIIERRLRRLGFGALCSMAIGTVSAVPGQRADRPTLSGAELATARAEILLTDVCDGRVETPSTACEQRLEKALVLLARVRATINEATETAASH